MNPDRPIDLAFNKIWTAFYPELTEENTTGFAATAKPE
jgi:hypothetical protein